MNEVLIEPLNDLLCGMNLNDDRQDSLDSPNIDEDSTKPTSDNSQCENKNSPEPNNDISNQSDPSKLASDIENEPNSIDSEKQDQAFENQEETEIELDKEKLEEHIKITRFLDDAYKFGANAIDLSRKGLNVVPKYMNKLENLQFLYLEGNNLTELPLDFFTVFHSLQWLDLRRNQLAELPTYGLNKHSHLRYLLLEYNLIKRLPFELGYLKDLCGLNLYKNPIEYPPQNIINNGVKAIKMFLRENDELHKVNNEIEKFKESKHDDEKWYASRDIWDSDEDEDEYYDVNDELNDIQKRQPSASSTKTGYSSSNNIKKKLYSSSALDLPFGAISDFKISKSLRPVTEMRNESQSRMQQAKLIANNLSKKNVKPRRLLSIQDKQHLSSDSYLFKNYELENALRNDRAEKYMKKKLSIDSKLQKIKDKDTVDDFRDELKEKQKKMRYKRLIKGVDYAEPAKLAPFDVDSNHMMVMSNETRIKLDQELKEASMRPVSPETLMRIEEERRVRDHLLQEKIRDYTNKLLSKRQTSVKDMTSPKKDRIEAAKTLRELKLIEKELEQRRMELQHNYKPYTGSSLIHKEMAKINSTAKIENFMRSKPR